MSQHKENHTIANIKPFLTKNPFQHVEKKKKKLLYCFFSFYYKQTYCNFSCLSWFSTGGKSQRQLENLYMLGLLLLFRGDSRFWDTPHGVSPLFCLCSFDHSISNLHSGFAHSVHYYKTVQNCKLYATVQHWKAELYLAFINLVNLLNETSCVNLPLLQSIWGCFFFLCIRITVESLAGKACNDAGEFW